MNKMLKELCIFVFSVVEVSLVFRFVLKLFGASSEAGFVNFIYENTTPLLSPFLLAFPHPSVNGKFVLEFTTLFAIFVYAFVSYLIQEVLDFIISKK
ncbi:YggT family protein [Candidatus Woesebacteria bacterium]|nr:YggT family protein [Candidatus Woesebacteria bacterium]